MTFSTLCASPIGPLRLTSDGEALTGVSFSSQLPSENPDAALAVFDDTRRWLDAYFTGSPGPIHFPLSPSGTDFQRRVWEILLGIPYGKTLCRSYRRS